MAGNSPSLSFGDEPLSAARDARRSRRVKALLRTLLPVIDTLMLVLSFVLAYYARANLPFFTQPPEQQSLILFAPIMGIHVTTILIAFYFSRLYHQRRAKSRFDVLRSIFGVVTVGALLANGIQELLLRNLLLIGDYPRSMFFYAWVFSVILVTSGREFFRVLQNQLHRNGEAMDNLLIIGSGHVARDIAKKVKDSPELGYHVVGVVNGEQEHKGRMLGIPVLGTYADLPHLIDALEVEQVIIALPDARRTELVELISLCQRGQVDIKLFPDIFAYMAGDLNVDDLSGTPLLTVRDIALRGWKLSLKRGLDLFGAVVGLVVLSPFILLTALLIRLESEGPIFYSQVRMGLDGRPFPMIKFRSMRRDAEASGPGWTVENDPRVTKIGAFLRKSNWDEIPQLINVLMGHMSLVGPRPERPVYVQEFRDQIPRYMERHREKAGMTGWAQVNGLRGDTSIAERTTYDLWYVENWSLWLDIKIIIRTAVQMLLRRSPNAY